MSILTDIENDLETTEADVLAVIAKIKTGVAVAAKEIEDGINWVINNAGNIASDIEEVESLVEQILGASGVKSATLTTAINEANAAVSALDAISSASSSGSGNAQALVDGYVAYQTAVSAVATAKAAAASTTATTTTAAAS